MIRPQRKHFLIAGVALLVCLISAAFFFTAKSGFFKGSDNLQYRNFDVSPDGQKIVFPAAGRGGNDLYLLNLVTRQVTRLTNTPEYENLPSFSPDGRSIVYEVAATLDGKPSLAIRSLDGTPVRQLTSGSAAADTFPSFSPDGTMITFARGDTFFPDSKNDMPADYLDVYIVNRNGSGLRRLTHERYHGVIRPRFSPDSRQIIFDRWVEDPHDHMDARISLVGLSGNSPVRELGHFGRSDIRPCFFPDGRQIVFLSDIREQYRHDLYKMDVAEKMPILVTTSRYGILDPVVMPDGKSILYAGGDENEVWQVNSDGSQAHQIADGSLFKDPMHWKPK